MIRVFTSLNFALAGLAVLATVAGVILIPADRQVPVRWGLDGSVTATAPKLLGLLQMPVAIAVVWLLFLAIGRYGNAERDAVRARTLSIALPVLTGVMAAVQVLIVVSGR